MKTHVVTNWRAAVPLRLDREKVICTRQSNAPNDLYGFWFPPESSIKHSGRQTSIPTSSCFSYSSCVTTHPSIWEIFRKLVWIDIVRRPWTAIRTFYLSNGTFIGVLQKRPGSLVLLFVLLRCTCCNLMTDDLRYSTILRTNPFLAWERGK